jgi:hypothetical protein
MVRVNLFIATFNNISAIIVAVSFIGGGNRSTRKIPSTCRKSLTNFITLKCRNIFFLYVINLTVIFKFLIKIDNVLYLPSVIKYCIRNFSI